MFSSLKKRAANFVEPYKQKEPAVYAAAEQAIGALLITDGFVGISNPFGRKRSGIFGTIGGMIIGIIFMFIPAFFGSITNIDNMTATTSATVVAVGEPAMASGGQGGAACSLTASYFVDGIPYTQTEAAASSNNCALSKGEIITINYDPAHPTSWIYGAKTINKIIWIFFWAGLLCLVSSIITFFIRLVSIIFGWKLLRDGRKNAANLPAGTNLQTMIDEIKKSFVADLFGFGNAASPSTAPKDGPGI